MTGPLRVAIVRQKPNPVRIVIAVGFSFLNALFLMLILGAITPWHPSYWTTVVALYGVQILRGPATGYLDWTWAPKKSEAQS